MTNRFLISVAAAALIAGTGFANAQGMNREGGGAAGGGSTTQQGGGAPSEKGGSSAAPMNRDSGPSGAKLTTEQQTKISTVIKQQNVAPVTNVNFSISVGTRVPRDVQFHTLPQEVVVIYPQWRGYRFIRVREEIVIIDPNTFEIVAII